MKITILYDNKSEEGFKSGGGFSCMIEHNDRKLLFDTGWDGEVLLYNMKKMGINSEALDAIVLSHDHWDHIGGLPQVILPEMEVFLPRSFSKRLKEEISRRANLLEVAGPQQIMEGVYTTGELGEHIKEQALAVETGGGIMVITGCAHPDLEILLDRARSFGDIGCVIGGFHDFGRLEQLNGLSRIFPCHCTAKKTEILSRFSERAEPCLVGRRVLLN